MNKPSPIPVKVTSDMCGDLLDSINQFGFAIECFNESQAEVKHEDDLEYEDFVPTDKPFSCRCKKYD